MFKDFLLKQMLKKQLAGMPQAEQDRIIKLVKENPELFKKIGDEIQAKIKQGKNQMTASIEVMKAHQDELRQIM